MLQLSYNVASPELQLVLLKDPEILYVLLELIKKEIKAVEIDMCNLTPGPDLTLQYAITQQRRICLTDLEAFFRTLQEKQLASE